MNKLWSRVQKATDSKKYIYQPIGMGEPFESGQHYLRIVMSEMFLEKSIAWFRGWYPAVHVGIQLAFGDQDAVNIARVVKPPEDATKHGVLRNYHILELTPYNGGIVEIQGALMGLQGEHYLGTAIEVLQSFSSLVAPPFAQALAIAEKVSDGLDSMVEATKGKARLPYHDTFVGKGMGANELRPGYLALIRAEAGQGTKQVLVNRLSVRDGALYYDGGGGKKPFRKADYMLLRFEKTDQRDDYDSLGAIKAGRDAFMDALDIVDEEEAKKALKQARRAINIAIRRSPDIAKYDKTRAWANIKAGLDEIEAEVGLGAMDVKRGTVTDLINSGPMTIQQAVGMGEPVLD